MNGIRGVTERQVRYLNDLLDNMNEVFYTYDLEGKLTYVNKKCLETTGYLLEEMLGHYGWDFIPERYKEIFRDATVKRLKESPARASYLITVQKKDGSERILRLNASPIVDNGAVLGEMVLAEDETERRQAEKTLKKNNILMQMMQ
ncbi:MAG: PAS domain-containing protein, partial [Deltaproteobacteria bacterium]